MPASTAAAADNPAPTRSGARGVSGTRAREPRLVHLGCFDQPAAGWVNLDKTPHLFVARVPGLARLLHGVGVLSDDRYRQHREGIFRRVRYTDLRRKLPFRDGSVDAFFASHVLEHLFLSESLELLAEMHRCLRPGGWLRLVLPDLEELLAAYAPERPETFLKGAFEMTSPGRDKNGHRWMFTASYLRRLLTEAGFSRTWTMAFRESHLDCFLPLDNRPYGSFYVEACK